MRVAVCISGQMRCVKKTFESIYKNIILPNDADVFIHSWYDPECIKTSCIDDRRARALEKDIHLHTVELYKPKKYLFDKPKSFHKTYHTLQVNKEWMAAVQEMNNHMSLEQCYNHTVDCTMSMYYSIYKCNELKEEYAIEHGIHYDYVIRLRFDVTLEKPFLVKELDPLYIYYAHINQPDELISDWFNVGSSTVMNLYASTYLAIRYLNTFQYYPKSERQGTTFRGCDYCIWGNEYFLRDIMHLYNVPAKPLLLPIKLWYE